MPALWRGISSVIIGAGRSTSQGTGSYADYRVPGPSHAAYFVTYEVVKQALGGNADTKHHPFVGGPY